MLLQIDGWVFDVDEEGTRERSALELAEHCSCKNCQNFYAALGTFCPHLGPFLARFGLFWDAPDRMSPVEYTLDRVDYDPQYHVFGTILEYGKTPMSAGNVTVTAQPSEGLLEGKPCFTLLVSDISLPWVLDPKDVDDPNIPQRSIFSRIFRKNPNIPQ